MIKTPDFKKLGKRLGDTDNLPPELKNQIQILRTDSIEDSAIEIINQLGGMANIDEILVGIYRKTGKIHKRPFMTNRLYRLMQDGIIFSVLKKKGTYCLDKELVNYFKEKE